MKAMLLKRGRWALAGALMMAAAGSQAALVTLDYSFTVDRSGAPAGYPTTPGTGSFTVTFDNSANISSTSSGLVASTNILFDGVLEYEYNAIADAFALGGSVNGAGGVGNSTNDFRVEVLSASTAPQPGNYLEVRAGSNVYSLPPSDVQFTQNPSNAVPEPASLALVGAAFGGLLLARRRKTGRAA